jgi:hypothetical protein
MRAERAFRFALAVLAAAGFKRAVLLALSDDASGVHLRSTLPVANAHDLVIDVATQIRAGRAGIEVVKS